MSAAGRDNRISRGFLVQYEAYVQRIEHLLPAVVSSAECDETQLSEAQTYSLAAGGKRIRPVMVLAVGEMLETDSDLLDAFACALECIHTYSLIHDDLPAMDNDELRRGRATNHVVYGDAMAILAGDALLNRAFEWILKALEKADSSMLADGLKAARLVADASGAGGMVGGQALDMNAGVKPATIEKLRKMHAMKTGALIRASVLVPALLCNTETTKMEALKRYAEALGIAFQIRDDLLDVTGDVTALGKPIGSDMKNNKTTFVSLLGLHGAETELSETVDEAVRALACFGEEADFLRELIVYVAGRDH